MDGEGPSLDRGSIRDTCSGSSPVFGRVLFGMGRSPSRSTRVRGVVQPGEVAAHQSSRNEGSFLRPSGIPRRCHRSSRDSDVQQLDGRGVRQQARGYGFPGSMLVDQPPSEMDGEFRRPSVLLASPGSPGRLRGCVSPSLGRPGSVRIPSLSSGRSGGRPCPRVVECRDESGRTPLAREGVVRRLTASTDPTTSRPALVGQSAPAAPLLPLPPRHPCAEPSRVLTLKRHF